MIFYTFFPTEQMMQHSARRVCGAVETVIIEGGFRLESGRQIDNVEVAYETFGARDSTGSNIILILPGMSASPHVCASSANDERGWWDRMVGPGLYIDTDAWHVVCMNYIGGCFGSTGPGTVDPTTGSPYGAAFSGLTVSDIARAVRRASDHLGIARYACIVGVSMGAMVGASLISQYPGLTRSHISICGATRATEFARAVRGLQRELMELAIRSVPDLESGAGAATVPDVIARKIALITYGTVTRWDQSNNGASDRWHGSDLRGFLDEQARAFWTRFDRTSYLNFSHAMDTTPDCAPLLESSADALDRALVMSSTTDSLWPPAQQRQIADTLVRGGCRDVTFREILSPSGHDAFLIDVGLFGPVVRSYLNPTGALDQLDNCSSDAAAESLEGSGAEYGLRN